MTRLVIIIILAFPLFFIAQTNSNDEDYTNNNVLRYDDFNYKPNIKTIQFNEISWEYATPLISLDGNEQLELSFDDIDGDVKQYSITFVHCNADWTPSDLMISEYLNGYVNLINTKL